MPDGQQSSLATLVPPSGHQVGESIALHRGAVFTRTARGSRLHIASSRASGTALCGMVAATVEPDAPYRAHVVCARCRAKAGAS